MSEADVHFELHRHLANAIDDSPQRGGRTYGSVRSEYTEGIKGSADLVIFDKNSSPVLVIEAKRPSGNTSRDIDPYSPKVIRQAHDYASELGAAYFATYNGKRLVLFRTFERGRQLLQRSTKSYTVGSVEKFADTLLTEIDRIETKESNWDSLDDAFIQRIDSFHEQIKPDLRTELTNYLDTDKDFHDRFVSWADAQGFEYDDSTEDEKQEIRENVATQATYLLINKIIFYKILESSSAYGSEVRPLAVSIHRVREDLEDHFTELVDNIDFEAIFEHDDIYGEIPLEDVSDRVREFIIELDDQDLTQFDSDVIGRIYEGVIPPDRRHEMGEYYTPPAICDLITQLTIEDANDMVLDPACGSGGFVVSAYNRKQELLSESAGSHTRIIDQLHGVDINRFPAHLTAINLAIQDLSSYTEKVNVEISDFFSVEPDTMRFSREQAGTEGSTRESEMVEETIGGFDVVVGNPPYIRQENISDKEYVRDHLSRLNSDSLSKRSDIYAYFLTHATEFLNNGGRLGFITSDRWLDTSYGADLQEFVLNNYCVDAIIKFDRQAFEDALVGATILILSNEDDKQKRDENIAKFLRVTEPMDIDDIVSVVENEGTQADQLIVTDSYRLTTRRQQSLQNEEKWNVFFIGPPFYFDIISHENTVQLGDVADIGYGVKSGANKFYYARKQEWEELGLEKYTSPLLKASGQIEKIRFDAEDAKEWGWLNVHNLVEQARDDVGDSLVDVDTEDKVKQWLSNHGHDELVSYIEWGEQQGYHERRSTEKRDVWFDLGDLEAPPMVMTDFTWREHRVIWNEANGVGTTQFYDIRPDSTIDTKVLGGILNSRLTWLMSELKGRRAGGAGMTRSRIKVYESKQLPIPDPKELSENEREKISTAFTQLMDYEDELDEDAPIEAKEDECDELDKAVLSTLDMENRLDELKQSVRKLVAMREKGAGEDTEVLVEKPDDREVIDLAGVSEVSEPTSLSDF